LLTDISNVIRTRQNTAVSERLANVYGTVQCKLAFDRRNCYVDIVSRQGRGAAKAMVVACYNVKVCHLSRIRIMLSTCPSIRQLICYRRS